MNVSLQLAFYDEIKGMLLKTSYFEDNLATHFSASIMAVSVMCFFLHLPSIALHLMTHVLKGQVRVLKGQVRVFRSECLGQSVRSGQS